MIPQDFIQALLSRIDIVETIDRYVPLKKAGANYSACCPFHSEKTPSFTVSPTKQFFHCFGCGAHGTAIGFLMDFAGKPFTEAVEDLAHQAGLQVPVSDRAVESTPTTPVQDLTSLLLTAARYYRTELKQAPRAIDYLRSRQLTGQVAARFGIGYAPAGWQPLANAVSDYQHPLLETSGLVVVGDGGKRYDRFRDRIMFPIHDASGQVIGFGGRVIGEGEPKYLNSPETALFSKGRELYGLYLARQAIRTAGKVVVVEGYMDVVALAQHGIDYVVATLGTATTPMHAQKLLRLTDTVVFCFDADSAGQRAAWRALENVLPILADGKDVRFLFLPEGDDPDDFVRRKGKTAFEQMIENALPLSDFMLRELAAKYPPSSAEGRAALINAAKPLLLQLRAPVLAVLIRHKLAALTGITDTDATELLPSLQVSGLGKPPKPVRKAPSLVRRLLRSLVWRPSLVHSIDLDSLLGPGNDSEAIAFIRRVVERYSEPATTGLLLQEAVGTPYGPIFEELAAELLMWDDDFPVESEFEGALAQLRRRNDDQEVQQLFSQGGLQALSADQRQRLKAYRQSGNFADAILPKQKLDSSELE